MKISWFEYWIWIPITLAIKERTSLYTIYSELFMINSIKLGKYKQYLIEEDEDNLYRAQVPHIYDN